jgi:RNA polymerase sigma factor (sigma-70 family)
METYSLLKADREEGIKRVFEVYAKKLLNYSTYKWNTEPDVTWDLIYKTIYKVADTIHKYEFENEQKFASFIFKVFINALRDYVRDTKSAFRGLVEVELNDAIINNYTGPPKESTPSLELQVLKQELDRLEDWQRILMLLRGQEMAYSEIARYVQKPEGQLKVYYSRLKKQMAERIQVELDKIKTKGNVQK